MDTFLYFYCFIIFMVELTKKEINNMLEDRAGYMSLREIEKGTYIIDGAYARPYDFFEIGAVELYDQRDLLERDL